ncbi:hypothetical protein TWF694_006820 [Orbilia ellipsospora]|uniref:Uncharacterized protein n=1 Tax=Orbilia ellipsospora TaxID=2528407 RepID=A0AAV9XLQ2_9PEZI
MKPLTPIYSILLMLYTLIYVQLSLSVAVRVPTSSWEHYIITERQTLRDIGIYIDHLKVMRRTQCPIGGEGDTGINRAYYHRSLSYLLDTLSTAFVELDTVRLDLRDQIRDTCLVKEYETARLGNMELEGEMALFEEKAGLRGEMETIDVLSNSGPIEEEREQSAVNKDGAAGYGEKSLTTLASPSVPDFDPLIKLELERWGCTTVNDMDQISNLMETLLNELSNARIRWQGVIRSVDRSVGYQNGPSTHFMNIMGIASQIEDARFWGALENGVPPSVVYQSDARDLYINTWLNATRMARDGRNFIENIGWDLESWMVGPAFEDLISSWDPAGNNNWSFRDLVEQLVLWFGCWETPTFLLADAVSNMLGHPPGPPGTVWQSRFLDSNRG